MRLFGEDLLLIGDIENNLSKWNIEKNSYSILYQHSKTITSIEISQTKLI